MNRTTQLESKTAFGEVFTDHMILAEWQEDRGWTDIQVLPFGDLHLSPSATVLHYGQAVFEGLKAYRQPDDSIALFRPEHNAARLAASARRLAMPELPTALFLRAVTALVSVDHRWVPSQDGHTLYVRPFLLGNEGRLGVGPARRATFHVIASPSGDYFANAQAGLRLFVSREFSRAGVGGTGAAKCGGNYAASLLPQREAQSRGCHQVLYSVERDGRRFVDECGTMNIFAVRDDGRLLTPELGTVLDGVTRRAVLELAAGRGMSPLETHIELESFLVDCAEGRITEVFATGTAATLAPVTHLVDGSQEVAISGADAGPVTVALREELLGIQFGTLPDAHGWLLPVPTK
ncbi:branched-chain amino acid aminotransferase [Kribbella sp. VKM Ac-2571]|uniref:branched-chain amino acid aminotransferase n=1 Tax=Kribbella sp. VKM Ac-2571 TaxID=2512222 RepID=UPI0010CF2B54|nr:branched-chain amino acid aminotransferase [Kribbella sp. VKM Ac-2571]TDO56654.1 branched-chain amino acid aminotransferase [Kribbella sp. VKM Ac-2571]